MNNNNNKTTTKVLVTGASGYLGEKLCYNLLNIGYSVRAYVRHTSDISFLPSPTSSPNFELAFGDITDFSSLLSAINGCHTIIHSAALVEPWLPDSSRFFTVNVGGLKNLIRACKESNSIQKIVYTSSFFALGPTDGGLTADENQLIERFNWQLPGYIGRGNDKYSFSYVDDVVEGHIAAMEKVKKDIQVNGIYLQERMHHSSMFLMLQLSLPTRVNLV